MRNSWAIAKNTIAQAVRMKIAAAVLLLLVVFLPTMAWTLTGDGTLLGRLQSFSSYSISLVGFLLSLLTIAVSCYSLHSDFRVRTIDLVITKPVARYQIVLGKFLGAAGLNLFLLAGFSCMIYGLTTAIPRFSKAPEDQIVRSQAEFFTARRVVAPQTSEEEIVKRVEERIETLRKNRQLPDLPMQQIRQTLLEQERIAQKSVEPAAVKEWDFQTVFPPKDPDSVLFVRYKFQAAPEPPNQEIFGQWRVGDFRQFRTGLREYKTPIYGVERSEATRTLHSFTVPGNAAAADGQVTVGFFNSPEMNFSTVIFDQMEVLYPVGGFGVNFFRVVLLMAIRLIFLAALGVSLSTWLSFPVATLFSLMVFFAGLINGFILESIESLGAVLGLVYRLTIRWFLYAIPRFDGPYSPTDYLVSGEVLSWAFLGKAVLVTLAVQMVLLLAIGIWIFSRREIAKVTV
ncbi:MAG: hypothetical protein WHS88_05615 [Anaerohalosphaeraceae bacterium]